ncbi:MAG: hypothetical protein BGO95_03905 [Micrococcales bacterium 73-13]|nr:MAG: hypothetical protein BGO95_03905 [Micrococcales bacterium 73-13]
MTRARRIAFWIAGALLALAVVGVVLAGVLLAPLDRQVVVHWDLAGEPDGWGPAWTYLVLIGVCGLLLAGIALVFALVPAPAARPVVDPEPIELAPGELAAWSRRVHVSWGFICAVLAAVAVTAAIAGLAIAATSGRAWPAVLLPILLLAALGLTGGWRVSAGPTGLTVRGLLGVPVFRVRTRDIADVVAVGVHPLRDFGGWGIRGAIAAGGHWCTGIVARAGEGIRVTRVSGRQLVVTVDEAALGAAVLKAYAQGSSAPVRSGRPGWRRGGDEGGEGE